MGWTERQVAMLEEMGLRVYAPAEAAAAAPADVAAPVAVEAEPKREPTEARRPTATPASPLTAPSTAAPIQVVPRGDRPTGIDTLGWPELREAVANCTACKLCEGRTQTVFGVGHERAHWLVVGEAPGEQEDRQGEPFVGKSGQLLDNMLRAINLTRDVAEPERQVYIANSVKCRPPFNRNPEPGELTQCEPFLVRQIQLLQPRIILAMGRFAVQSLLRSNEPIGRLRGRVHRYEGVPLVVTYHPAYLLRNPEDKSRAWDDLCLAREAMAAR